MNIFKTAAGGFINLDRMALWNDHPDGNGILIYESGDSSRCVHLTDSRDVADMKAILHAAAHDLREETGITYQGKRVKK